MDSKKKILVIDDDPDILEICRIALEPAGYGVTGAPSAAEGKAAVGATAPDFVILDIMMEEADSGLQLAHWLHEQHPDLPVMLMSSILNAGAAVFDINSVPAAIRVNKPLSPKEIVAQVTDLLERKA